MSTPVKAFNIPPNSPAASQTKPKIRSPAVRPLELGWTLVYSRVITQGDATKAKTIQSFELYPLNLHLPYFTRFDPVENTKLQVPNHISL